MDASIDTEINRRINLGWRAFGKASWALKDKSIPITLKRKLYNQCILPTVSYGSETWNLTRKQTKKLSSMQRAQERIILNISLRDHITSDFIRSKTRVTDIIKLICEKKWRWAGHVARRNDNRWTSRTTFWTPYGSKRKRGRQKLRWRDDLDKYRKLWHQDATDRNKWRILEEAYARCSWKAE